MKLVFNAKKFGEAIHRERQKRGYPGRQYSGAQLQRETGLTSVHIKRLEEGSQQNPGIATIMRLCAWMECSAWEFIEDSDGELDTSALAAGDTRPSIPSTASAPTDAPALAHTLSLFERDALSDRLGLVGDARVNEDEFLYLALMLQAHRTHQMLTGKRA